MEQLGLEMTSKSIDFTPCHRKGHLPLDRVLRAISSLAFNTSREGAAPASLGNVCHAITTLTGKSFLPISNLNLPPFSLKPFTLVLSLQNPLQKYQAKGRCSGVPRFECNYTKQPWIIQYREMNFVPGIQQSSPKAQQLHQGKSSEARDGCSNVQERRDATSTALNHSRAGPQLSAPQAPVSWYKRELFCNFCDSTGPSTMDCRQHSQPVSSITV